jgi:hypothetical protein
MYSNEGKTANTKKNNPANALGRRKGNKRGFSRLFEIKSMSGKRAIPDKSNTSNGILIFWGKSPQPA